MTASVTFSIVIGGTSVSPDGASINAPTASTLSTADGTWGFGPTMLQYGYSILRDGADTGAQAVEMEVYQGSLFLKDANSNWFKFSAPATYTQVSAPPSLSKVWNPPLPGGATFNDTTPLGTVVAIVQGVWSDGHPYADGYRFMAPAYDGSNAPPVGTSVVKSSTNYTLGDVVSAADAAAITSTGIYALVECPNTSAALILNTHGPGVSGAGGTTENVNVELY